MTFAQLSATPYQFRDAVRFDNGREILLQQLQRGQRVEVLSLSSGDCEHEGHRGLRSTARFLGMRLTRTTVVLQLPREGGRHGTVVRVGTTQELETLEAGKLVEAAGQRIAIFNLSGEVGRSRIRVPIEVDRCRRACWQRMRSCARGTARDST